MNFVQFFTRIEDRFINVTGDANSEGDSGDTIRKVYESILISLRSTIPFCC